MVEEIERLISRGRSAGGTVTPASWGHAAEFWSRARQIDPRPAQRCWKWTRGPAAADLLDAAA